MGYRFKDDAVYFTMLQRSANEESSRRSKESSQFTMYFTRAQAGELAKLFDQDYLLELVGDQAIPPPPPNDTEKDIYIP